MRCMKPECLFNSVLFCFQKRELLLSSLLERHVRGYSPEVHPGSKSQHLCERFRMAEPDPGGIEHQAILNSKQ